jgi:hypothetical protein
MDAVLTDVMFHVDESLAEDALTDIEESIRRDAGVVSVGHRPGCNHLMMAIYDSETQHAANLLHSFRDRGLHAQIIGL